jgi:hypothetical protein
LSSGLTGIVVAAQLIMISGSDGSYKGKRRKAGMREA